MRLVSDGLDPSRLRHLLDGRRFGNALTVVESTGSTNFDVTALARSGSPDGLVLIAEHQSAGRGRAGRRWESPPRRGVLLSVLLVPGPPLFLSGLVPLATGLAVCDAIERVVPSFEPALKWPNDVLAGTSKVGGILVESELGDAGLRHVVVGIGLNVNHADGEVPENATSLRIETGSLVDREPLVVALLIALERRLAELPEPEGVLAAYRRRSATLGRAVRVERSDGAVTGTAIDVDATGALVVEGTAGTEHISFGDVIHLRAADDA